MARTIEALEKRLIEAPCDFVHDIHHHQAVLKNCQNIVESEKLLLDMQSLKYSAMSHDIDREDKDNKIIKKILRDSAVSEECVEKTIAIVSEHSFGSKQTMDEARVLYDADKLEYLSLSRYKNWKDAMDEGLIAEEKISEYAKVWKARIREVRQILNFECSKVEFDSRMERLKEVSETDTFLKKFIVGMI